MHCIFVLHVYYTPYHIEKNRSVYFYSWYIIIVRLISPIFTLIFIEDIIMLITIKDDFNLFKICNSGQCFRCPTVNGYTRFIFRNHILYIKQLSDESYDISCTEELWNTIWLPYFDLTRSYKKIRRLTTKDTFMKKATREGLGIRILRQDPWEMVITFILSQRKSIPAIKKSVEALCIHFGSLVTTEHEIVYLFPTPEQLKDATDDILSECGLGYRLPYVKDAVEQALYNTIVTNEWYEFDDHTLFTMLKSIKGVGDKVANCIMLFGYNRIGRAPVDTWIEKIINTKYNGVDPFPSYGDVAGIMQQYAFYYSLQHKDEF